MKNTQLIQDNINTLDININTDETITFTTTSTVDKSDYLQKLQDNLDTNTESIKNLQGLIDDLIQVNVDIQSSIDTVTSADASMGKISIG